MQDSSPSRATAKSDADGDGLSNLAEWKARTNPQNKRDAFIITSVTTPPAGAPRLIYRATVP